VSKIISLPKRLAVFAWLATLFVALSCGPVRLVSPYDAVLDEGTTTLHTKVAAFVGKMTILSGKPEGTYEANKHFYPEVVAEVSSLRLRAAAVPKNEISVKLFDELAANLERLRKLHEISADGGLSPVVAGPALAALDVNFQSIVKFEIAKRRGESD
jgi:hypothetical protein